MNDSTRLDLFTVSWTVTSKTQIRVAFHSLQGRSHIPSSNPHDETRHHPRPHSCLETLTVVSLYRTTYCSSLFAFYNFYNTYVYNVRILPFII